MARRSVGSVSRTRVSSLTTPSLSGTLKSTRMSTRLPRTSTSLIVSLFMHSLGGGVMLQRACHALKLRGHELDQIAATAGISPLVVIPGQHFHATIADNFRIAGIDDGRVRIALEIS